ncbi:DMT family transporter [Chachezhania sediminis]|uniref:DMT family transporter n=1 Tax=Chachezhania sediminis TaxID=2599291 RepID=UPI00131C025C|nr:DMT family transporter [Chachezhania sediminis]
MTDTTPILQSAPAEAPVRMMRGVLFGLLAVLLWAGSMAYSRQGIQMGLSPADILVIRFGVSGLVLLPWLLRAGIGDLAGVGWPRGIALTLCAGVGFVFLGAAGYMFTPLSHGAVIQPSTASLGGLLVGWLFLGERMTSSRTIGTLLVVSGVALIASRSLMMAEAMPDAWIGDLIFVGAGLCWVGFTVAVRQWKIGSMAAASIVAVLSAAIVLPGFLMLGTFDRLAALPWHAIAGQALFQGLGAGIIAIAAFTRAVTDLGTARAALFPGIVPAATLAVGIPVTGEFPTTTEALGALLASLGLTVGLGALDRRRVQAQA